MDGYSPWDDYTGGGHGHSDRERPELKEVWGENWKMRICVESMSWWMVMKWKLGVKVFCPWIPIIDFAGQYWNQYPLMCYVSSFPYRGPKLRILDLRHDPDCETTCSEIRTTFPFCFQSCIYSQDSILKTEEAKHRVRCLGIGNSESQPQSAQEPMELLVDISLNSVMRTQRFHSFLCRKVQQSCGSLHLCCRDLQINKMSALRRILQFLDLGCIDHLEVNQAYLSEVITLLAQMIHLNSLSLSNVPFKTYRRRNFRSFLIWLRRLDNLQELSLSFFCLTDQLHKLLRWGGGEDWGSHC